MNKWLLVLLAYCTAISALTISPETANTLGDRIWKNECAGTIDGLTHWGKGENFPSLGIGHFLWYPTGVKERFDEGFPKLLSFLQEHGVSLPAWIKEAKGAPWDSRDHFYRQFQSEQMKQLRELLAGTKSLQAIFIAKRLENALPLMLEQVSPSEGERISALFYELAKSPEGLYALVDYNNFKGAGVLESERYNGQGWGLLQVLQGMQTATTAEFVASAKKVLAQRIANSPPERNENRWRAGWFNRLDTYLHGT
ncbi:MAG: hypothetical protein JSR58_00605 [Verrucomicrobia bacterium]|nr:hypothetical protein [Verrucomicrobiota bacterium]